MILNDDQAVAIFSEFVGSYSSWVHRVTETVELSRGTMRRHVTLAFSVPEAQQPPASRARRLVGLRTKRDSPRTQEILVPLFSVKRGRRLIDNLDVEDGAGQRLPVLAQHENKELAGVLLQYRFDLSLYQRKLIKPVPPEVRQQCRWLLSAIPLLASPQESLQLARRTFDGRFSPWLEGHQQALAEFFATNFILTAVMPAPSSAHAVVRYSFDSPWTTRLAGRDRLRQLLGQRPYNLQVPIPRAFTCDSYHFRMTALPGQFCDRQGVYMEAAPGTERLVPFDIHAVGARRGQPSNDRTLIECRGGEVRGLP